LPLQPRLSAKFGGYPAQYPGMENAYLKTMGKRLEFLRPSSEKAFGKA
jgi:hypothetical protein